MTVTNRIEIPPISPAMKQVLDNMLEIEKHLKTMAKAKPPTKPIETQLVTVEAVTGTMQSAVTAFGMFVSRISSMISRILWVLGPVGRVIAAGITIGNLVVMGATAMAGVLISMTRLMWSFMVKLGDAMLADHLGVLITGSSWGGFQSFRSAMAPVSADPAGLLERMRMAVLDRTSAGAVALSALHVRQTGDTVAVTIAAMIAARRLLRNTPIGSTQPLAEAYRLTALFSPTELSIMRSMSDAEFQTYLDIQRKAALPEISLKARIGWANFTARVEIASEAITNIIAEKLASAGIVDNIRRMGETFSKAITTFLRSEVGGKLIEKIKGYLQWLSDKLGSSTIIDDISNAITKKYIPMATEWLAVVVKVWEAVKAVLRFLGFDVSSAPDIEAFKETGAGGGGKTGHAVDEENRPAIRYGGRNVGGRGGNRGGGGPVGGGGGGDGGGPVAGGPSAGSFGLGVKPGIQAEIAGIDPKLKEIMGAAAGHLPPGYKVRISSGYSPTHGAAGSRHRWFGHSAMDVQIIDPDGNVIRNRGDDPTGLYTRLARAATGEMEARYPELKGKFAWGRSFGVTGRDRTPDIMHFDVGGERGDPRFFPSHMGPLPGEEYGVEAERRRKGVAPHSRAGSETDPASEEKKKGVINQRTLKIDNRMGDHDVEWRLTHNVALSGI